MLGVAPVKFKTWIRILRSSWPSRKEANSRGGGVGDIYAVEADCVLGQKISLCPTSRTGRF
jgi:hypothetical protein